MLPGDLRTARGMDPDSRTSENDILTIVFSYPLTWTVTSIAFIVYYLFFSRLKIVGRKR